MNRHGSFLGENFGSYRVSSQCKSTLAPYVSGALHGADFVFLRFSFYGGLAAVLILQMQREGAELHFRHAMKAMTLGAVGYAFSFLCTYFAVELVE